MGYHQFAPCRPPLKWRLSRLCLLRRIRPPSGVWQGSGGAPETPSLPASTPQRTRSPHCTTNIRQNKTSSRHYLLYMQCTHTSFYKQSRPNCDECAKPGQNIRRSATTAVSQGTTRSLVANALQSERTKQCQTTLTEIVTNFIYP